MQQFKSTSIKKIEIVQLRKEFGLKKNDKLIIFVGRMGREKRVRELFDSIIPVMEEIPNVKMIFVGAIFEYFGPGVKTLSIPERASITNMGAELGATTSLFPTDEVTLEFLKTQGRESDYIEITAEEGAEYDEIIEVDLSKLEPLAAQPHSPDNVIPVSEIEDTVVNQVAIGSCTNSSYRDLWIAGKILEGKTIAKNVSLLISPGSKQVFSMISKDGTLVNI